LTADWIPTAEKTAAGIIRVRSFEMTAIFILMAAALLFIGASISRSILNPLRRMVDFLGAMATGDLSNHFEVDSTDEMSEVAQALNSTTHTFREVLTSIQEASERTASASAELTATAKDTSERSRVHAAETQQVSAALFEMSAAIAEVSKSAQYAASSGVATETAADQGSHVVDETMSVIRRAAEITSEAAEQIQSLGKSSEQIGRIVGVIEEIASQTNLLALNAAIEAARAGEQGRGFAVVAGEVRRLAERTTTATKEISEMISSIQQETSGAVKSMANGRQQVDTGLKKVEECSHALTEIVKLVRTEGGMVDQIASASVEQTSTANQVTESMHSIARFTEYATAAGEQTADACGELTKLASTLEQQVQRFKFGTGRMGTAA
jgi:methyl-accepting chemotaxis protein